MRSREFTQAKKEYRQFDKRRNIIIKTLVGLLVAILICFIASFRVVDKNHAPLLLFTGTLIVHTVITILICKLSITSTSLALMQIVNPII